MDARVARRNLGQNDALFLERTLANQAFAHLDAPRLVVAELKTVNGRMTSDQRMWLDAFHAAGKPETRLWRPTDWADVIRTLRPDGRGHAAVHP